MTVATVPPYPYPYPSDIGGFVIGFSPIGGPIYAPTTPGIIKTIRSYLYWQYSDDDDLQAFVAAYNAMSQQYLDWFNTVDLPVYTGLSGYLLDWVATGLYGYPRPVLPSGRTRDRGPYGTYPYGTTLPYGALRRVAPTTYYATSDDVYKRCLTWHFYKGDGKYFNVRWLKRRIMRFLTGTDGTAGLTDETYQVSIQFGTNNQVNINILNGQRLLTGGSFYGRLRYGAARALGSLQTTFRRYAPLTLGPVLQAAISSGALELPFQYRFIVTIVG